MRWNAPLWIKIGLFLVIVFILVLYLFVWGYLFPYTPIVIGFKHQEHDKAKIYYHQGTDVASYANIDSLIVATEDFHQLSYRLPVAIFICRSDQEYERLTDSKARACAFPLYGRIFISTRLDRGFTSGRRHRDVYLRHELSHALLYQNMSLRRAIKFPEWLLEGIATYSADQRGVDGYYDKSEVRDYMRQGNFYPPRLFGEHFVFPSERIPRIPLTDSHHFIYAEFACIVEELIRNYGNAKFILYLHTLLHEKDADQVFRAVYPISFDTFVAEFRRRYTAPISEQKVPLHPNSGSNFQ